MAIENQVNIYLKPPHKRVNVAEGVFRKVFLKEDEPFEVDKKDFGKYLKKTGLFETKKRNEGNIILDAMMKAIDKGRVTKAGLPKDSAIDEFAGFEVAAAERDRLLPSLPDEYKEKIKAFKKKKK